MILLTIITVVLTLMRFFDEQFISVFPSLISQTNSQTMINTLLTGMQALCDCGSIDKISSAQVTHDVFI